MSTMKISWGTKIAFLYGGFVILIAALVTGSMRQDFDLVSADYYQQELKYQEVIDAGKNQAALSTPVHLSANGNEVKIEFPAEMQAAITGGSIHFYSQVNADWDKEYKLENGGTLLLPRADLQKTLYQVKMRWIADGKEYYQESNLNLSK